MSPRRIDRPNFLTRGAALAGTALLAGCDDLSRQPWMRRILDSAETLTRVTQRALLSPSDLAREFSEADISKTLKGKNLKVESEMVKLEGMIKQCGLYEVDLNLGYEITSKVKVMVVPLSQEKK